MTKAASEQEKDNDLTMQAIERAHTKIVFKGIHYGDCDFVTVKAQCNCMAPFDAGILIGAIIKNRAEYDY